jgi:hypothetical protein
MFELRLPNQRSAPKAAILERATNAARGVAIFGKLKG